ncbi:MAG TPA: TonB-dependent receptor plug domain-containing protein [Rhodanobacteraceae bacterium]
MYARFALLPLALTCALAAHAGTTGTAALKPAHAAHPQTLQTIVVTGSAVAVKQLDAGYNIHIANRTQIQQLNPFNTGELLEMVSPGTWSEPTGGESAGATIVAGFPNTKGAPFSTVMVNGAPLYGAAQLSFFDTSTLFRIDDTISRVEVVQGGTGAIVGPGQAGATANFILRTGGTTPAGDIGLTYGSEGRERVDGFVGLPLAHGWSASVGGFYRISNGIRDPQYKADQGGQLTATLKHATRRSKLVLWTRVLNDKNLFLKQIPLIQAPDGSLHAYPGFNPLTGIYNSDAIAHSMVPNPAGGLKAADLPDGRGANLRFFGGDYKATLDSWTLADHMVASYGHLPGVALFPGSNPQPLGVYLYGCNVAQPAGFCTPAGEPVDTHTLKYPAGRAVQATLPDGDAVPLDQSVIVQQLTADYKRIWSLSNDFRASYEIFSGNTLTAGIYLARYGVNDNSSSGNQMLLLNQPHTLPVGITYTDGGQTFAQFNSEGLDFSHAKTALSAGTATNRALYLADTWTLGRWTLVAGGRVENENARSRTCKTHKVDLDGNPLTLFDNQAPVCNGQWDDEHYDKTHPSFALSANYRFNAHASVYANASTGGHFDDFTHGIEQAGGDFPPLLKVKDVEVGFRYLSPHWFVNVNAYHRLFTGIQYQETDRNGVAIPGAISSYGSNAHGVNLIARFSPTARLSLTLAGNVVRGHYTHNDACVPGFNVDGVAECLGFDGNPLARQPEVHYRFTPEYTLPTSFGNVTAWLAYTHVGQRYQDETGVQPLGVYNTLAAGVVANVGPAWQFRVQGTNLTNALGITEGNTAVLGSSTGASGVIMARPLFGRELFVAAKYRF